MKNKNKKIIIISSIITCLLIILIVIALFINFNKKENDSKPKPTDKDNSGASILVPNIEVVDEKTLALKTAIMASIDRTNKFKVVSSTPIDNNLYNVVIKNETKKNDMTFQVNMKEMTAYQVFQTTSKGAE